MANTTLSGYITIDYPTLQKIQGITNSSSTPVYIPVNFGNIPVTNTVSNTTSNTKSNTVSNTVTNTVVNTVSNTVSNTKSNTVSNVVSNTVVNTVVNTTSNTVVNTSYASVLGYNLVSVPPMNNNWDAAHQFTVNGVSYWPESAEKPYDIQYATNATTDLTRFEVRANELWSGAMGGNDTERAELDGSASALYAPGTNWWFAYDVMVEPGAPQVYPPTDPNAPGQPASWLVLGQVHGENENPVPWQLNSVLDTLNITIQNGPTQNWVTLWTDTAPTPRGTWRRIVGNVQIQGTTKDYCRVWIDGKLVANYTGLIGTANAVDHTYLKFGVYRGWQNEGLPPYAVWYANVQQGTANLSARVTNPPALPSVKA